jgi:hypothetical protein
MRKAAFLALLVTLAMMLGCQFSIGAGMDSRVYHAGDKDPRRELMKQQGYREKSPVCELQVGGIPDLEPLKERPADEPVEPAQASTPTSTPAPSSGKRSLLRW